MVKEDSTYIKKGDRVWTPIVVAKDMVAWFKPQGKILEPCNGIGNISNLIPDCLTCEITEGTDFLEWTEKVDWIITNPPYSIFSKIIKHGLTVSDNPVWLLPTWKMFSGYGLMLKVKEHGGIKHMRHYGTGTKLGWSPLANSISAVHIQRDYTGDISQSYFNWQSETNKD